MSKWGEIIYSIKVIEVLININFLLEDLWFFGVINWKDDKVWVISKEGNIIF